MVRRLHLVRHGQSTWNAAGRLQGQTQDVPLTSLGRRQARTAATMLAAWPVSRLLTSDLLRAEQTAQIIGAGIAVAPAPDARLREQALGSLEGARTRELVPATTTAGTLEPDRRRGGGESVADVHHRVGSLLRSLLVDPTPGDVVLVSHGDTVRIAAAWLSGRCPHEVSWFPVPNGAITTVQCTGPQPARATGGMGG